MSLFKKIYKDFEILVEFIIIYDNLLIKNTLIRYILSAIIYFKSYIDSTQLLKVLTKVEYILGKY